MKKTAKELELAIAAGVATSEDFEGWDANDVMEMKAKLPMLRKLPALAMAVKQTPEQAAEKVLSLIANVQVVDRMGDLVLSNPKDAKKYGGAGWVTGYFDMAGGPYLHRHEPDYVVGKVIAHRVQKVKLDAALAGVDSAHALVIDVKFFDDPVLPFSQGDYLLALAGITGSSVGFLAQMMTWIEDEEERAKLGLGRFGAVISTMELLEVSKAVIPANQFSVALGGQKALSDAVDRCVSEGVVAGDGKVLKLDAKMAAAYKRMPSIEEQAARVRSKVRGWAEIRGGSLGLACLDASCGCETSKGAADLVLMNDQMGDELDAIYTSLGVDGPESARTKIAALIKGGPSVHAQAEAAYERVSEAAEDLREIVETLDGGEGDEKALASDEGVGHHMGLLERLEGAVASLEAMAAGTRGKASGSPGGRQAAPAPEAGDGDRDASAARTAAAVAALLDGQMLAEHVTRRL